MDPVLLSRIQFGLTISFHYIYPPLSIGLGVILVLMEALYLKTRDPLFQQMTRFWTRVFGLTFALGVATGVVMEFQFGTNWANYSRFVGDVFGSALAAEGIFAFFLESGFLAHPALRLGQGQPADAHVLHGHGGPGGPLQRRLDRGGRFVDADAGRFPRRAGRAQIPGRDRGLLGRWCSTPPPMVRLSHTVLGAWQSAAFFVLSVSAFYLLKRRHVEFAQASMKIGLVVAVAASLGSLADRSLQRAWW